MKILLGAAALMMFVSGAALAQSLPNTGPAGNPNVDSYGKIYSGARPLPTKPQRYTTTTHRHKKIKRHRPRR
ncbi:MAG TPA: hypothetical protein VNQ56_01155 [Pseudolabrys sp.]|nr:hypothetical protein [Pseudolabrys sp.]